MVGGACWLLADRVLRELVRGDFEGWAERSQAESLRHDDRSKIGRPFPDAQRGLFPGGFFSTTIKGEEAGW